MYPFLLLFNINVPPRVKKTTKELLQYIPCPYFWHTLLLIGFLSLYLIRQEIKAFEKSEGEIELPEPLNEK